MMPKNAVWMVLIISIFFLASVSAVFAAPIGCRFHCEDSGGFIGGIKINDLNGNGMQDHGEPGLQGWEITLTGPVTASRITDASGFYNFHDLPDGTYRICEVRQSGWEQTYPNAGLSCAGGTKGYTITINNGESFYHVDFRNTAVHLGSVSGMKFDDINMDGHWQAGEPRLQDWTIKLTGHHEATAITDSHGDYHFHDLPDETYIVCEIPQAGWQQISPSSGPSCTAGSKGYNVTVANGNAIEHKDFGNAHKQKGSISGYKWEDINHNMQEDPGEGRLPDWTIFLDQDNDDILDSGEPSTITDLNGHFIFSNLMPGTYYVREVLKEGWIQITPNPDPIVVTDGEQITGIKFGNQNVSATIIIRGIKFNDLNGNGAKDAGEPGLQGWNIFLDENGNNQFDAGEMSAVTDAGGNYEFKNLIPGTYIVREVQQPGWQQTTQNPAPINAEPGNIYDNINFGNKHLP
ncbi:MAG: hypothetical protein HY513_02780, partial [Candidatus Aenigmarchaeota archaeon]|nr:hypothetical protein [Candidatus Aenigmarchaeota archaeon]